MDKLKNELNFFNEEKMKLENKIEIKENNFDRI